MKLPKKSDALVGEDKFLEDDEDNFLNPEDLSIIDEKTWEPSDEEILSYALKLGYDIEKDPDELFEVAYYYMKYPLPEGWKRAIYKKTKELMYINMEDGEIEVATEIEEMAHQMYLEKKEEMLEKKLGDKGSGLGIGGSPKETKIPPINEKKSPSLLPPVKEKNGSKNSLFNELEKELDKNKEKEKEKEKNDKKDFNIALLERSDKKKEKEEILDKEKEKEKERKKNNDDIFGISQKPVMNNIIKEDNKENMKESEENDKAENKNKDLYGIHAEESEEEKEYGDDFDFDGLEDDSEGHKGEPLIKSMINKEKEMEKEKNEEIEKLEKERLEKERIEKEKKEKEEKEIKERLLREEQEKKEKLLREEQEKKERLKLELEKEKEKEKELNEKLEKEKKEYLNQKLKELQLYKEEKKKKYEQTKKDIKSKANKLKEEYESKYERDLNDKKQKLESQYNQKLEFYEAQLINKKLTEEKKYREDKEYTYKEKQKELKRKKEKEIEEKNIRLKEKKSKLLKQIKEERLEKEKQESNYKEKKIKIQNNIKLLEEKKKIDLSNLDKKLDLSIKDFEIDSEKKFSKEKELMQESFKSQSSNILLNYNNNSSSSNLNFSISGLNNDENNDFIKSKIMEDIQKAMDKDYEITCRSIEQEFTNNKMKEIEKYKSSLAKEKEEKLKNFKNDEASIEKDYYKSIADIRQNSQNKKVEGDNYINLGFEQTLKQNEETKNKISKDNKKLMELFLEGIQKLISKNNTLEQTEIQIEEFLMELKDNYHMTLQKNKNTYEIAEYDYKLKKLFIKYLLEVINYLGKIFSSSNTDIYEMDEKNISENLLKFCKDKISSCKMKFQNKKKKRIFNFLNESLLGNNSFLNMSEFEDTRESTSAFVNSFKRKSENEINNMTTKDSLKNDNFNFLNRINIDESINNINKNSFIFKNRNNLSESVNNLKKFNTLYNFNNNPFNNDNLFRTLSQNEYNYNINEGFFKILNKEKENEDIKLEYYTLDQNKNYMIPLIPEKILDKIDEEILNSYSEIVLFLKNEYLKLIEIEKNENLNNTKNKKINTKLNLLILDKIKIYTEEAFNYIINNYYKKEKILYIGKKLQLIKKQMEDFKSNFNVDKYLKNPDIYNPNVSKKNTSLNINGQINYKKDENNINKEENNGMNNLILNGNFKGSK